MKSFLILLSTIVGVSDLVALPTGIYWANDSENRIMRSGLDGSSVTTLISDLSNPRGVYATDNYLYWSDEGNNSIQRSDLNGSGITTLVTTSNPQSLFVVTNSVPDTGTTILLFGSSIVLLTGFRRKFMKK